MRKPIVFLLMAICCCCAKQAFAVDIYMKINGVNGPVTTTSFVNYFEVAQVGQANTSCTVGGVPCNPTVGDLTVQLPANTDVVPLQPKLLAGTAIATVDIVYISDEAKAAVYYEIHLDNVLVKSISEVGNVNGPVDQVAFTFDKISWKYIPQNANGSSGTVVIGCYTVSSKVAGTTSSSCNTTFPF